MADNVDKRIAYAVVSWLKTKQADDEGLEVAMQCISESFGINVDKDTSLDIGLQLTPLFKEQMAKTQSSGDNSDASEAKLQEFISILKNKGYFNGVQEGSPQYWEKYETAKRKFQQRNDPYAGLSAEQLKAQGNNKMVQHQYKEAVGFYSKAIECEPTNAIFYCNRAAAYTHLKEYAKAVEDSERSLTLDSNYSKAYSRLGTALFYQDHYQKAVDAYARAVELDPDNEVYKADLKSAEAKLASAEQAKNAPAGMPDFSQLGSFMQNPEFLNMANSFLQQPQFANMVSSFAQNMKANNQMPDLAQMFSSLQMPEGGAEGGAPAVGPDGEIPTPFGNINQSHIEELRNSPEIRDNPKFQAIMEDVKASGPAAMLKYASDPEVMSTITKVATKLFQQPPGGAPGGGDDDTPPPQLT